MDLWIRSQTRTGLISAKLIYVRSALRVKGEEKKDVYQVIASDEIVAEYSTEERALEVIDEIQELLTTRICFENYNSFNLIYEMPKE